MMTMKGVTAIQGIGMSWESMMYLILMEFSISFASPAPLEDMELTALTCATTDIPPQRLKFLPAKRRVKLAR
jgi:hypothetical protein